MVISLRPEAYILTVYRELANRYPEYQIDLIGDIDRNLHHYAYCDITFCRGAGGNGPLYPEPFVADLGKVVSFVDKYCRDRPEKDYRLGV
jgi:hypothetical protein